MCPNLDLFTKTRLERFVRDFRTKNGQLPTLQDLAKNGFDKATVTKGLKEKVIEEFYVTLSNGTVVKGFKVNSGDRL